MMSHNEMQLQLHRARIGLVSVKSLITKITKTKRAITALEFQILLEASKYSKDYRDSLLVHTAITKLGVEQAQ